MSLAVGMAQIFCGLPGMRGLMAYWYHFAIMFEAVFILTTVDSGTRVGRFLVQEFGGRVWSRSSATRNGCRASLGRDRVSWCCRGAISSGPATSTRSGRCSASPTSCSARLRSPSATTILINMGRREVAWVTFLPLCFLSVTTMTAGYMSIRDNFWPLAVHVNPDLHVQVVLSISTTIMMACCLMILAAAIWRWMRVLTGRIPQLELADA